MTTDPLTPPTSDTRPARRLAGEKLAWWIVFSALAVSIVGMAGLWN